MSSSSGDCRFNNTDFIEELESFTEDRPCTDGRISSV